MENQFALELAKLFMFSICIAATVEVIKAIALRISGDDLTTPTMQTLNFAVALVYCYVLGYGIMLRVFFSGDQPKGQLASWLDYIATASLLYLGADWIFNKFSASIAKAKAVKALAQDSSVVTSKKETSQTVTEERTVS